MNEKYIFMLLLIIMIIMVSMFTVVAMDQVNEVRELNMKIDELGCNAWLEYNYIDPDSIPGIFDPTGSVNYGQ